MRIPHAAWLLGVVALAACQGSDVGAPCRLIPSTATLPTNVIDDATVGADFVASNVPSCDDLTCIKSPTRSSGYCSRPCVSNADCQSGLVCRTLTFDASFFVDHPDLKAQYAPYLGPVTTAAYCATPRQ